MVHVPLVHRDFSPRVTVLMATYNGRQWIEEQIESILTQEVVSVRLVVSDDGSTDGTREFLEERAQREPRIHVLAPRNGPAGVAANFLHLFTTHEPDGSYVAFSDQDDIWYPDKLKRQVSLLQSLGLDAVSSNVTSFDASGREKLIRKSRPQRKWDHLFEAAGPGSTYIFTPALHAKLRDVLSTLDYSRVGVHDWYIYALARAQGARWLIDETPTVLYRQHGGNVQGANLGIFAHISRLSRLSQGFYGEQFIETARAVSACNVYTKARNNDLDQMIELLENSDLKSRVALLKRASQIRRSFVEGLELAVSRVLRVW
ncbi:glycosyltransferase family 2 protein [Schaalia sp. ZJ405]|uniref:glycosyltransferase family 2 protein n=1 Tax=unclassified Schaalia TaxID=2691889 RepID=UPI0013EB533E|nr:MULTISPECIES: glycosyltransferase family 2 protein [unclassified Schaalia]QPK81720.1 glycosyltransferase family 2 protein [Schaalia sp. ZJ405]